MIFQHNQTKIVNFSASQIYNIIADVPSYKYFIKWIKEVNELSSTIVDKNQKTVDYKIIVGFNFIEESFTTRDYFIANKSINIQLLDGIFKTLNSSWNFNALDDNNTEINFSVDFSFKSLIIEKLFAKVFLMANEKITNAFIARANEIYQNKS